MRSKVPSILIGTILVAAAIAFATPVWAKCNTTLMTGVTSRYVLGDFALVASNKPGFVSDVALTCPGPFDGTVTVDWWQRSDLSTKGPYGGRGFGDEHDFTITGNWSAGPYDLELQASYFAVAPLGHMKDDVIQLYADIGQRFDLGFAKAKLAIRPTQYLGIGTFPAHTTVRARAPVTFPIYGLPVENVSFRVEPAATYDFNPRGPQARISFRPEAGFKWAVNDRWELQLNGAAAMAVVGGASGKFHHQIELVSVWKLN